ncbi:hypothetical protein F5B21DRAFT_494544 [Xylaria acuta]|nr:hypothetical protein F5B21DRAFT_494544 [Xylaria acuta]
MAHKFSCTNFNALCQKIFLLASVGNSKLPTNALHLVNRLKSWQSTHERMAKVSGVSELMKQYHERPFDAHYEGKIYHTGCRQDIIDALFALKWPEKTHRGSNHSEHGHYWEDSVVLSPESRRQSIFSATSTRHGSIVSVMFKMRENPIKFKRSSIAAGLSWHELRTYDGVRQKLLNPLTRIVRRTNDISLGRKENSKELPSDAGAMQHQGIQHETLHG